MDNSILIILTGILASFLGGMFGFGGSSITTPLLRIFFLIPPYQALASPLPMTFISSSISGRKYCGERLIDWDAVKKMAPVMIIGSFAGAYITRYINGEIMMLLTALFLIYVALRFIFKWEEKIRIARGWEIILGGALIGLVSGMLANGGGILIVPILMFLGLGIKKAIGTSIALVFVVSIPSILVHWYLGHIDWWLSFLLSLGAVPGAYAGAHVTLRLDRDKLRRYYGVFLLTFSIFFATFEIANL